MTPTPLLSIRDLSIRFPTEAGWANAVQNLSLDLMPGQILGLVGESGCGKSMSSLAILRLIPPPGQIASGAITFQDTALLDLSDEAMRRIRGAQIALIPQDPLTSLNPVYTIGAQIMEVLQLHQGLSQQDAQRKTIELLDQVRLPNAKERIGEYPHQFSGGMRQRVMIAMALSCAPALLIADEPTTALDVTVQAQILDLMREIQREHGTAILLITHDLGVVAEICDEVAVMYAGRIIEQAPVVDLFRQPMHPYTRGLLNSLPTLTRTRLEPIEGQPPSITQIPPGCAFEPRCKERLAICTSAFPAPHHPSPAHRVHCYLYEAGQTPTAATGASESA
jgi:oligopeptide/dipeptide ABC transporter ATP-binding protein